MWSSHALNGSESFIEEAFIAFLEGFRPASSVTILLTRLPEEDADADERVPAPRRSD
jgi:hypothetical protein